MGDSTCSAMMAVSRYYAKGYVDFQHSVLKNEGISLRLLPEVWAFDVVDDLSGRHPLVALALFESIIQMEPDGPAFEHIAIGGLVHVLNAISPKDEDIAIEAIHGSTELQAAMKHLWVAGLDENGAPPQAN